MQFYNDHIFLGNIVIPGGVNGQAPGGVTQVNRTGNATVITTQAPQQQLPGYQNSAYNPDVNTANIQPMGFVAPAPEYNVQGIM